MEGNINIIKSRKNKKKHINTKKRKYCHERKRDEIKVKVQQQRKF